MSFTNEFAWNTHTHTCYFNGPFSETTQVSRYQKNKINLDFTEARDSEWQWHQLGHMQVCNSRQTTTPAPHHSVFTGWMPFLQPNQQRQSTEGNSPKNGIIMNIAKHMMIWTLPLVLNPCCPLMSHCEYMLNSHFTLSVCDRLREKMTSSTQTGST